MKLKFKKKFKKRHPKGFTLVELIVVIVIITILTGTVSVSFNDINEKTRLSNASTKALADVRYAQELAMSNNREINIYVTPSNETYDIKWQDTGAYVPSATDNGENLTVTFGVGEYKQIDIVSTSIGNRLSFTALGEPMINGSRFTRSTSVMFLNSTIHLVVYPSGYTCLEEVVGSGCTGC